MMTYLYGYHGGRASLATMETRTSWNRIHPEMRRRLVAMMDEAPDDFGFGSGWRSTAAQRALFLSRYHLDPNGSSVYNGQRYTKNAGAASAAPPGRSYHEETTSDGFCLAADMINNKWANQNCGRFGLRHFADVNDEPWHYQPVEIPGSRRLYRGQKLAVWKLGTAPPPPPVPTPGNLIKSAPPSLPFPLRQIVLDGQPEDLARTRWLQQICNERFGGTLRVDGDFGPGTFNAVVKMQRILDAQPNVQVGADGVYGQQTAAALAAWLAVH